MNLSNDSYVILLCARNSTERYYRTGGGNPIELFQPADRQT